MFDVNNSGPTYETAYEQVRQMVTVMRQSAEMNLKWGHEYAPVLLGHLREIEHRMNELMPVSDADCEVQKRRDD